MKRYIKIDFKKHPNFGTKTLLFKSDVFSLIDFIAKLPSINDGNEYVFISYLN